MRISLLLAPILLLTGCAHRAHFETSGGGHQISAAVEGEHTIDSQATHAAISSPFGAVTIERARAKIDTGSWQNIPEGVPVRTSISKHTVSIRAGNVTITRTVH